MERTVVLDIHLHFGLHVCKMFPSKVENVVWFLQQASANEIVQQSLDLRVILNVSHMLGLKFSLPCAS